MYNCDFPIAISVLLMSATEIEMRFYTVDACHHICLQSTKLVENHILQREYDISNSRALSGKFTHKWNSVWQ